MTRQSLFRRVTRYAPGPLSTPAENRLTEAFAAVLEYADDSLAAAVLDEWGIATRGPVSVHTQVWSGGGRHIDLELCHGDSLCWVEVKHGARLHADQLFNYQTDLARREHDAARRCLILLAPVGFDDDGQSDFADDVSTWQSVGVVLMNWLQAQKDHDPVHAWLVAQFLEFLREERLAVTQPLDAEDLKVLARRRGSEQTFAHVLGEVHDMVAAKWRTRRDESNNWPRNVRREWWPEGWEGWSPGPGFRPYTYIGWGVTHFDPTG